jgi:hypothetical protein
MQETLYLQRLLLEEVKFFHKHLDTNDLDLRDWKARGPARVILLAAWLRKRTDKSAAASIDLRGAGLDAKDAKLLAKLLKQEATLSIDVRLNETLGVEGAEVLATWLHSDDAKAQVGRPFRSLCGVTTDNTRLVIQRNIGAHPADLAIVVAELLANVWGEGISSAMGEEKVPSKLVLMRRSTTFANQWHPLIWAARNSFTSIVRAMVKEPYNQDINEKEDGKSNNGFSAAHHCVAKGNVEMLETLGSLGANLNAEDKHGQSVIMLATQKHETACIEFLKKWGARTDDDARVAKVAKSMPGWA